MVKSTKPRGRKAGIPSANRELQLYIVLEDYIPDKGERQIAIQRIREVFKPAKQD
jgi:hypothetical protein